MASKKIGCPLSSIFQQWTVQNQRQQVDAESRPSPSSLAYRILLQTSYSLKDRITAAEPVENPHLYKRAGLTTPPERANRDIYGAGETAWLLRLVELATKQQQKFPDSDSSQCDDGSIIFLKTKSRPRDYCIVEELPADARGEVQVLDVGSRDPFGWDEKDTDTTDVPFSTLDNLRELYQKLQEELDRKSASGKPVILIWQSLTPLIVMHGFRKVLRLLCALPPCLQIWPINLQIMTPAQHAQLEDASNAILQLRGGEMNIIRQGIREPGNVLRKKLPFRLEAIASDKYKQPAFRVVDETQEDEQRNDGDEDDRKSKASKSVEKDEYGATVSEKSKSRDSSKSDSRPRSTALRLEESDGGRNDSVGGNLSSENEASAPSRPRIYLQDDDPEFDDFDEEDPDDDLDI